ncbi:hypothetical protein C5167_006589 [Papaver somniferum]|uniref:Uncharacterized protein n=1 Tax=Papaver somniferum TaxID=3469 RepID=A0A4Y7JEP3_PAPSO|nr:hypothetical protein C5167_006589 [Papaver somniferum]
MSSYNNNHINQLSRQLRRANIELPATRRAVGSSQSFTTAADEWLFGVLGKLMWKEKIDMRTIRSEVNSLWRNYRNKQIRVMKYTNGVPITDYKFTHQVFTIQFKYLKLEHLNSEVVDEAIGYMGRKISTTPSNCRPRYGNTVKARIKMSLKEPLHREAWWNTTTNGKCFAIDHDDRKCMYTFHLLYLDTLNDEEYQDYLNNEADVYEGNERESMDKDEMALIMESIGNEHESRQRKRMRNSELNNEPLMNPHNIHVQPPNTTNPANTTNRGNCNNSMMEATEPRANTAETTVHSQSHTMQKKNNIFLVSSGRNEDKVAAME